MLTTWNKSYKFIAQDDLLDLILDRFFGDDLDLI
jgi:hypothetical protein